MPIYPKLSIGLSSFLLKSFESPKSRILINELAEYEFSLSRLSIFMTYSDIFEMSSFLLDLFQTSTVICSSNCPSCDLSVITLCFIAFELGQIFVQVFVQVGWSSCYSLQNHPQTVFLRSHLCMGLSLRSMYGHHRFR